MKVTLLKTIKGLGPQGDVVNVNKGFALNYLIPKNQALPATNNDEAVIQKKREHMRKVHIQKYKQAKNLASSIQKLPFIIRKEATQGNQLYSAINQKDISSSLASHGIYIAHSSIRIKNKIKSLGIYMIEIRLYHHIKTKINIHVMRTQQKKSNTSLK